jgi:hypothetical protein
VIDDMPNSSKVIRHILAGVPLLLIGSLISYEGQIQNEILQTTCLEWAKAHIVCGSTVCSLPQICPYLSTLTLFGISLGYGYVDAELAFGPLFVIIGLAVVLLMFRGQGSISVPTTRQVTSVP